MKKLISSVLCLSMVLSFSATAFAGSNVTTSQQGTPQIEMDTYATTNVDGTYTEKVDYIDSLGDTYTLEYIRDDEKSTSATFNSSNVIISKSEHINGTDYLTNTTYNNGKISATEKISMDAFSDTSEINEVIRNIAISNSFDSITSSNAARSDTVPGSSSYQYHKTYNTDYIYLGKILTGDGYYRKVGTYDSYKRVPHSFVRNTTINAIALSLGGFYSFLTGAKTLQVIIGMGISVTGNVITTDWNFWSEIRAFDYKFKTVMKYNNSNITVSEIDRQLEYLYAYDSINKTESYIYDDYAYSSPAEAVTMRCSEAVGYAAAAFNAKYIAAHTPNLPLPVNGHSY